MSIYSHPDYFPQISSNPIPGTGAIIYSRISQNKRCGVFKSFSQISLKRQEMDALTVCKKENIIVKASFFDDDDSDEDDFEPDYYDESDVDCYGTYARYSNDAVDHLPGIQAALWSLSSGDTLIVSSLTQLSINKMRLYRFLDVLRDNNIRLISINDFIDTKIKELEYHFKIIICILDHKSKLMIKQDQEMELFLENNI